MEKVRLALEHVEDEERKQASLMTARAEFQAKYQQALSKRRTDKDSNLDTLCHDENDADDDTDAANVQENESSASAHPQDATETQVTASENEPALQMMDTGLVEAFERFTLAKSNNSSHQDTIKNLPPSRTLLGNQPVKKPHYIEVLEKTEKSVNSRKTRFKPNQ